MSEAACQLVSASHVCVLDLVDLSSIATTSENEGAFLATVLPSLSLLLLPPPGRLLFFRSSKRVPHAERVSTSRRLPREDCRINRYWIGRGALLVSVRLGLARGVSRLSLSFSAARRTSPFPFPFP